MTKALLVQGTHGWGYSDDLQWWDRRSPFCAFLRLQGIETLGGDRPFTWSTALDGIGKYLQRSFKKHRTWESAGNALDWYCRPALMEKYDDYLPLVDRNLIGHSHAMQVIAYACAQGLKINRLVTISSPVREDMREVYAQARPNIGEWLHVHSDGSDRIQWFGELLDGHLGVVREQAFADRNVLVAAVSHSRLLNDPTTFGLWRSTGVLQFLSGGLNARLERPGDDRHDSKA